MFFISGSHNHRTKNSTWHEIESSDRKMSGFDSGYPETSGGIRKKYTEKYQRRSSINSVSSVGSRVPGGFRLYFRISLSQYAIDVGPGHLKI